jgi:hypothetical protein
VAADAEAGVGTDAGVEAADEAVEVNDASRSTPTPATCAAARSSNCVNEMMDVESSAKIVVCGRTVKWNDASGGEASIVVRIGDSIARPVVPNTAALDGLNGVEADELANTVND